MVVSMERWIGKVAVVTGASSGIGEAIAKQLVQEGMIVAALARRKEKLDKIRNELETKVNGTVNGNNNINSCKGAFHPVKCDVSKPEDVSAAFKWILENLGPIDVLVNNAGIVDFQLFSDGDIDSWRNIIDTNLFGVILCTKEALKIMKSQKINGHIVTINSVLGHNVSKELIGTNVYPATKYGITGLSELIRLELAVEGSKIRITSISPGATETSISNANADKTVAFQSSMLSGSDIADAVVYVLATPPHVQVKELTIKPTGELF